MSRRVRAIAVSAVCSVACSLLVSSSTSAQAASTFNRIATFEVTSNPGSGIAEIVAAADSGQTLIYTDAEAGLIGFVDISDPTAPAAGGTLVTGGSPTSVAIAGSRALVAVDDTVTEGDGTFGPHAGRLLVVDLPTRTVVRTSTRADSPTRSRWRRAGSSPSVAIENQRDEAVAGGVMPHIPANGAERSEPGFVTIVNLAGAPAGWTVRNVEPHGPGRDEVQYRPRARVRRHQRQRDGRGQPPGEQPPRRHRAPLGGRHPPLERGQRGRPGRRHLGDAARHRVQGTSASPGSRTRSAWIQNGGRILTADEGDYEGGSRSFTLFDLNTLVAGRRRGRDSSCRTCATGTTWRAGRRTRASSPRAWPSGSSAGRSWRSSAPSGPTRSASTAWSATLQLPAAPPHRRVARGSAADRRPQPVRHRQRGRGHPVDLPVRSGPAKYPTILSVDSAPRAPSRARPRRSPGAPCPPWPPTAARPAGSSPSTTAPTPTAASTRSTPRPRRPASSTSPTSRALTRRAGTSRASPLVQLRPAPASGWPARATPTPTPRLRSASTTSSGWHLTEPC